ncbi:MAG: YafY family transcriptional regulator [Dehalococcoidales bacterium]|nr:YafY family transcriptional regulator [Dehalococcoidales bacterium]
MKINRLLEITIILLSRGTITAAELAERFGVSSRTIYRDIDVLSTAGVPVYTQKGNGGGISLLEDFTLNKTLFTRQESESLFLALKTLRSTRYPEIESVLDKIGALFKKTASTDWVDIDFASWGSSPNDHNKLVDIKKAILEFKVISFDYINAEGIKSHRQMEPMQLLFRGHSWYLWGFCRRRMDFRTFRLSRIKNLCVTDTVFQRKELAERVSTGSNTVSKTPVVLVLKFQPEVLVRLYDDFDEEMIVKNPDGTFEITLAFPEDEWVYGYILGFGCFVEVLSPPHIREIITDRIQKALKLYQKTS